VKQPTKTRNGLEYYVNGILHGDRVVLAQAITLIESTLSSDQQVASQLIEKIIPASGKSIRIGITGAPGVGKSTFIEAFGKYITGIGKKTAVLTIDPSSQRTKGSILGDKTRMAELAVNPNAFIRPSSSGDALGGVGHKTREAILLCEASGFEVILIETVGVGQSEVVVKNMTDFFLLLMLPGSGDELQGIKKGIMEMADLIVVTKADGETLAKARQSQAEFQQAINLLQDHDASDIPKVLTVSALEGNGIPAVFDTVAEFIATTMMNGAFDRNRSHQNVSYMHEYFHHLLKGDLVNSSYVEKVKELETEVINRKLSPEAAGKKLFQLFTEYIQTKSS
jgi:LAO/AO transport system kinase